MSGAKVEVKTATYEKTRADWRGDVRVYRLDPPFGTVDRVTVSAVGAGRHEFAETAIFSGAPDNVTGTTNGLAKIPTDSHASALAVIGYVIAVEPGDSPTK